MADDLLPKDVPLQRIHTLQTDTAEAVGKNKISQASLIAEKDRQKRATPERTVFPEYTPAPSHLLRNLGVTFLSFLVIAASGYGILKTAKERSAQAPVNTPPVDQVQALLVYNNLKSISFSNEEFNNKNTLATKLLEVAIPAGEGVTFYQLNTSIKNILAVLSPVMPPEFSRSIAPEDFFGGIPEGNFFIIKTDSYELAFSSLLKWEQNMETDLFSLLGLDASEELVSFEDKIIANKDARVAVNSRGETLFLYGFYNSDVIIFARNEAVFKSVYDMLLRSNL
jgi:hypothetical protein